MTKDCRTANFNITVYSVFDESQENLTLQSYVQKLISTCINNSDFFKFLFIFNIVSQL